VSPPLRAAFFDLGGTLVEAVPGEDHWRPVVMARVLQEFGPRPRAEALYAAEIRRYSPDDPHRQETNRWIGEWLREQGEIWTDADVERLRVAFASPLPDAFSLAPGAEATLRWCKAHGLTVAVLTNTITRGDLEVQGDCRRLAVDGLIDHVVSSYSIGWSKPHPAMFERALSLARVGASNAFMVGDEFIADVVGAKRVGMRAIWKSARSVPDASYAERPDATIASLVELPDLLESWSRG
jgi:FMN phosphatase YigB (HAD superfamily)